MGPITGYRELTHEEITLVNAVKGLAADCGNVIDELRKDPNLDQRWVSIGATHLQQGFMAIIRGITRPTTF
jgi:hypothetical protein